MTAPSNHTIETSSTPDRTSSARGNEVDLTIPLGAWSAAAATLFNLAYLIILVANFSLVGFTYPPPELTQLTASVVSLAGAPLLVVVWLCLRRTVPAGRRVLVEIGTAFMILLTAMTCINRYVYLAIVRQAGESAWVELIHPYGQRSIMFAIEFLGWGFFLGLACLFTAFAFTQRGLERWLRWLLAGCGVLSLASALGLVIPNSTLMMAGFPAWGILLTATTALLAVRFRNFHTATF